MPKRVSTAKTIRGFSLVEVLVVLALIAILGTLAGKVVAGIISSVEYSMVCKRAEVCNSVLASAANMEAENIPPSGAEVEKYTRALSSWSIYYDENQNDSYDDEEMKFGVLGDLGLLEDPPDGVYVYMADDGPIPRIIVSTEPKNLSFPVVTGASAIPAVK